MTCDKTHKCAEPCGLCPEQWPVPAGSEATQSPAEAHGDRVRAALERFCDATACIPMPGERVTTTMVQTIGMALSEARAALEFKAQPKSTEPVYRRRTDAEALDCANRLNRSFPPSSLKDEAADHIRELVAVVQAPAVGAVPPGFVLVESPITEEMHQAACNVLLRASGLDGTPQRMLDALIAPRPGKKEFDLDSFVAAFFRAVDTRGWSAKQVAEATGVSETTISRMRNHGRAPDAASLAALADWAGINPAKHMKQAASHVPSVQPTGGA